MGQHDESETMNLIVPYNVVYEYIWRDSNDAVMFSRVLASVSFFNRLFQYNYLHFFQDRFKFEWIKLANILQI